MSKALCIYFVAISVLHSLGATYYCDPVNGATANDGSAAHPWQTFGEAMAAPKTLSAGDTVYLRRGYHGEFTLSGVNTDYVTVLAEPGHTPTLKLTLMNAQYWCFKNITFLKGVVIDTDANEGSPNNTFEGCYLPDGGFSIFCTNIKILNNHIRNGGIHYNYHSHNGLARGNVIEDFYSDAMNMKASFCTLEYNLVLDSHKVDGNHNDCLQGWGSKGNVIRGNVFAVYTDPTRSDISDGESSPEGISITQGIGCFDGTFDSWIIENNVLFIDHPIGIWILGATNCTIKNNTVVRCGENPWSASRLPNISIQSKKPTPNGAPSTGNVVINNLAEAYELSDAGNAGVSVGINSNNVIASKSAFTSTFLAWAKKDLRLKAGSNPIDKGTGNHNPPAIDADQSPRPTGVTWDAGAYEYGTTTVADTTSPSVPTQLVAIVVAGYGVDLSWQPSTDNRAVAGYDVFTNGVKVGRIRSGCNYMHVSANTTASYTLKAFDFSGNFSAASDPAGGTPPVPDTTAPTPPANVTATPLSASSIKVSWSPSTDNLAVTEYDIYTTNGVLLASTALTSYTDTGLSASTLYTYIIKAKDAAGNVSESSAPAIATTQAAEVPAAVLAEETFDYAAGNLVGLNGGTGWSGAWTVDSRYDTEAGAYSVTDGIFTNIPGLKNAGRYGSFLAGGTGTYYPYAQRLLTTPVTDDGGTYWLAFQLQAPSYHKDASITLLGTSVPLVKLKTDVMGMNFQFLGGTFHAPGDTATHIFVIKIQMSGDANPEGATLYYDPNLNSDPAAWSALRTGTFTLADGALTGFRTDSARAGNTGYRFNIDEIRLATAWQEAVGKKKTTGTLLLMM